MSIRANNANGNWSSNRFDALKPANRRYGFENRSEELDQNDLRDGSGKY